MLELEINEQRYYELIAQKVRDDSARKARLTSTRVLESIIPDPGKIRSYLTVMAGLEGYRDLKIIMAVNGDFFAYSGQSISRKDAESMVLGEEVRTQIVARVRADSNQNVRLTPIDSLGNSIPGAELDRVDGHLMFLLDDQRYKDIRLITNSRRGRYLYSDLSMSPTYAGVLARAETDDPAATIAATVREESRIYPRPTNLSVFTAPVFKINPSELERHANEMVRKPEYSDIKLVQASTGALYLYSETYLQRDFARATAEWEEVGRYQNP